MIATADFKGSMYKIQVYLNGKYPENVCDKDQEDKDKKELTRNIRKTVPDSFSYIVKKKLSSSNKRSCANMDVKIISNVLVFAYKEEC